jgi:hypothetical protein
MTQIANIALPSPYSNHENGSDMFLRNVLPKCIDKLFKACYSVLKGNDKIGLYGNMRSIKYEYLT